MRKFKTTTYIFGGIIALMLLISFILPIVILKAA